MLWVPNKGALLTEHNFGNVGSLNLGTSVTTGTPATAKGTAVELIAATAFDSYLIEITASGYGVAAGVSRGCLDILVGAATEEVLISNLLMGYSGALGLANPGPKRWLFPLYIPAGTRIAARTAGERLTTASRVGIQLWGGNGYPPFRCGTRVVTYGGAAVPDGVSVTPGASAAEGSWTQIVASTTESAFCIVPSAQPAGTDTTLTASGIWMDIGVGAATEEVIAGGGRESSFLWSLSANEMVQGPTNAIPLFADIPSGQRLAARLSRSSAADTTAAWHVSLHAVSG